MTATRRKKIVLLGSTGSIGTSTLKVAREIPSSMEIVAIAANRSVQSLVQQQAETGAKHVGIYDETKYAELKALLPQDVTIHVGPQGLIELATLAEAEMVLVAIVGTKGLHPTLAAIEAKKDIALASKEVLVMAGEIVMPAARKHGVKILPVDSEHNAIFQCLEGHQGGGKEVSRLILTASGGPFRTLPASELPHVTLQQALKHPTWSMGQKITIDSATLFNKGLEMIEARWLFDIEMSKVDVIVHPQSIIHSMVEFVDGSILSQLSTTDMCFPIQYAVTYPERLKNSLKPINFAELQKLEFEAPRVEDFPAINLARRAGEQGGILSTTFNAANEIAVDAFVAEEIRFNQIWETVEDVMNHTSDHQASNLDDLIQADEEARIRATELFKPVR